MLACKASVAQYTVINSRSASTGSGGPFEDVPGSGFTWAASGAQMYGECLPRLGSGRGKVAAGQLDSAFGPGFANREEKDGVKLNFDDGSWILFRKSGTEPMIRIYCESPDGGRVLEMLDAAVRELDAD